MKTERSTERLKRFRGQVDVRRKSVTCIHKISASAFAEKCERCAKLCIVSLAVLFYISNSLI